MSLASRAGDLYYTFRFLKLLTTPWEETEAFKLGLIDEKGKRLKNVPIETSEQKDAYTTFMRLVFNVKRTLNKLPGGTNRLASYASALYLIKEQLQLSDKAVKKIITEMNIDVNDFLLEKVEWYLLDNKQLAQGIYRVRENKLLAKTCDDVVRSNDKIRIMDKSYPIGDMMGLDIYEAIHINTNQPIYITLGEIYK